jgi:hypothetical protein
MTIRRIFPLSAIICVLFCILLFTYGRPVGLLLYTKWQVRNASELWIVPTPLPVTAAGKSAGKSLSYFGYEFESPWTEVKRERKFESMAILNFSNGDMITILDHKKGASPLEVMKQAATQRGSDIRNVFGDETTRTNYALRSKIFYLTPRDLRLSWSRREMAGNSVLLVLKQIWAPRAKGGLYSFQTEWFHGFQSGDPAHADVVIIEAFDAQDQEVELWIGSEHQANNKPSQEDINRVLYSLHPVSALQLK